MFAKLFVKDSILSAVRLFGIICLILLSVEVFASEDNDKTDNTCSITLLSSQAYGAGDILQGRIEIQRGGNRREFYIVSSRPSWHFGVPHSFFDLNEMVGKKVLDVGAGGGALVAEFLEHGVDIYGVDLKKTLGNAKLRNRFILGDMVFLPFADGSFDIAYSNNSYFAYTYYDKPDFLPQSRRAIAELERVLKPGGFLKLYDVHNFEAFEALINETKYLKVTTQSYFDGVIIAIVRKMPFD